MGNSPSQTAQPSPGEPDDFDLNAISDGSGGEDMKGSQEKASAARADRKRGAKRLLGLTTALTQTPTSISPPRKLKTNKQESAAIDDFSCLTPAAEDMPLRDPDETSSEGTSSNAISVVVPSPRLQVTRTERIGGAKRKRSSPMAEQTPVTKPRKRRKEKSSPPTSVEPAEKKLSQVRPSATESGSQQSGIQALEHDATLMTREKTPQPPTSLRLPLRSDVDETEVAEPEMAEIGAEVVEPPLRRNRTTTVAKRTFPFVVKKAGASRRNLQAEANNTNSTSGQEHQAIAQDEQSDDEQSSDSYSPSPKHHGVIARRSQNRMTADENTAFDGSDATSASDTSVHPKASKLKRKRSSVTQKQSLILKRPPKTPQSARARSQRGLDNKPSDAALDSGLPKSQEKRKCAEYDEVFRSRKLLEEHGSETRHVVRTVRTIATGRFSNDEIQKLEKHKADFCRMHDITSLEFNDMMTDSCRRGAGHVWLHDFITKQEFLTQYFDVLPKRNRKSMARFRERNWQNATGNKDWTIEDDNQIVKLVKELGAKWVEIGQALTRTQDAVQQRWKNVLQYRDTRKDGIWSPEENEILEKAVARAKKRGGLSQDESTDKNIAWSIVSDALNGTRTPKQCADRWQSIREREGNQRTWRDEKNDNSDTFMSKSSRRRKQLSATYIDDSDDNLEVTDQNEPGSKTSKETQELGNEEAEAPETVLHFENTKQEANTFIQPSNDGEHVSASQSRRQNENGQSRDIRPVSQDLQEKAQEGSNHWSPELPPVLKKTPSKGITLSQAFANTQANTSALRRTQLHTLPPTGDRPSPHIPVKFRLQSSTIEETFVDPHEDENAHTQDSASIQEPITFQSTFATTAQAGGQSATSSSDSESEDESESESDEDEELFGATKKALSPTYEQKVSKGDEPEDKSESAPEEEASDEDDLQPLPVMSPWVGSREAKKLLGEEETSSEGESDNEDDGSSDEETTSSSDSNEDDSEDSMVEDTRNDFMASIKQTAQKAELAKKQGGSRIAKITVEDSDTDDDSGSDVESIAYA